MSVQGDVTAYWAVLKPQLTPAQTEPAVNIMTYNYMTNP